MKIEISTDVGVWVTVLLYLIGMGYAVYEWITRGRNDNENGPAVNNGADNNNGRNAEGQANPPEGVELAPV